MVRVMLTGGGEVMVTGGEVMLTGGDDFSDWW